MSARREAILAEVADIARIVLEAPRLEVTRTTRLDEIPGWDSMSHIAIVVEAECRFGIQFDISEIEQFSRIGELVDVIATKSALTPA